ncbi:N-acetylmuramoyl-L-alanine amidase [Streptomyces sp. NPDC005786]|uniref:N-acetylmuramoyl-L-alanine amidase n=1 Tax=Streptomyces sp. NPDC005786 TaxID=3154891 RepID=UPI0033D1349E
MAEPLSAAAVLAALRAEGVRVVEVGSWRTHNRDHKGPWGPVNGSVVHHTVTKGTASSVAIVRDGDAELPGPLCHGMIAKDGRVHLVGWGRTNHAGGGDPAVLAHVIAEDYDTRPPAPTRGNKDGVDGNAHFYGWECENLGDGKDPWPAAQYDAIVRVQAALCRAHGWSAKSVIGHLEWSSDKVDPRGFTMPDLRADVERRLTHPASWNPGSDTSEEDDMPTPLEVWGYRNANEDKASFKKTGKHIPDAYKHLRDTDAHVTALRTEVAALTKAIATLTELVRRA